MRRVQLLDVGGGILTESERLTVAFAPRRIDRPTGFKPEFVARVRAQCSEQKLELIQTPRKDLLQVGHLPKAPAFIILFAQCSHCHQHIHRADIAFGLQNLAGYSLGFTCEFSLVHAAEAGLNAVPEPGDGGADDFIHTEKMVLLDRDRHIRGYYDGLKDTSTSKCADDIVYLTLEKKKH